MRDAILPLASDERFRVFIEEIAEQQRMAMLDAINERVVSNERLSMAAVGEIRAYQGILDLYEGFRDHAEQVAQQIAEQEG